MNPKLVERLNSFIIRSREERDKLFQIGIQEFSKNGSERRDFYAKIATMSATIGAFSFLVFDSKVIKSILLLKIGDSILLACIIVSIYLYMRSLKKHSFELYENYYLSVGNRTQDIDMTSKLISGEITQGEWRSYIDKETRKLDPFRKPPKPKFRSNNLITCLFMIAIFFISFSFFLNEIYIEQFVNFIQQKLLTS